MRNHGGPDVVNRTGYSKPSVTGWFGNLQGYSDAGERVVLDSLAEEMHGRTILDVGVGGGRTIPLLRAISEDYAAIDFSEEMVRLCRRLHPGVKIDVGDARDLGPFTTGSIDLVVFSYGGIDHVTHDDRRLILGEVHRVLKPGGAFVFSTHNQRGPGHDEKPWGSRRELTQPRHLAGLALFFPINMRNHLRNRRFATDGDGWSLRNAAFGHFSMVFHYTTVSKQVEELVAVGFQSGPDVYEFGSGRRIRSGEEADSWLFHVVARRPRS